MPSYEQFDPGPEIVINPSTVRASIKTIASLLAFAAMFFTALVGFARDLDLNGALLFLQRDDVVKSLSAFATFAYLAWRAIAARRKKLVEVKLAKAAPDDVAVLSTELAVAKDLDLPLTRARETATAAGTRLVTMADALGRIPPMPPAKAPGVEPPARPARDDGGVVTSLRHVDPFSGKPHHSIVDVQPAPSDSMRAPALFVPGDPFEMSTVPLPPKSAAPVAQDLLDLATAQAGDVRPLFAAATAKAAVTGYATWLSRVLREAGCEVIEIEGWESRGHGPMGTIRGVLCHHTASRLGGTAPSVGIVTNGRPDLAGPLAHLVLGRDGTYHLIAAGRCYHAGAGKWQDIVDGNRAFIGIEAENVGTGAEPWPAVQMDAYARGCAAILAFLRADVSMCVGHKEYALPKGRKIDPAFDMESFRDRVEAQMGLAAGKMPPVLPEAMPVPQANPARAMLSRGAVGQDVVTLQQALGMVGTAVDGKFGPATLAWVIAFQRAHNLVPDGKVGPKTWALLLKR